MPSSPIPLPWEGGGGGGAKTTIMRIVRQRKNKSGRNRTGVSAGRARATTVKKIRGIMGRTQTELASALGVSPKAIQSYEQGWRDVPVRVLIQLLVLLALYRKRTLDDIPCWEIRKCTAAQRETCASFTVGRGQFCWFVGSKDCRPLKGGRSTPVLPCMECPVVRRLLAGRRVDAGI